jgi:hypothetical protein
MNMLDPKMRKVAQLLRQALDLLEEDGTAEAGVIRNPEWFRETGHLSDNGIDHIESLFAQGLTAYAVAQKMGMSYRATSIRYDAWRRKMDIVLDDKELGELMRQEPGKERDGGWQALIGRLQKNADRSTGALILSAKDMEQIPRYAFKYGNGGWEDTLKTIFGRHLGPELGKS